MSYGFSKEELEKEVEFLDTKCLKLQDILDEQKKVLRQCKQYLEADNIEMPYASKEFLDLLNATRRLTK